MRGQTSGILGLVEAAILKLMPDIALEERRSLRDLAIKVVLMISSPELSLEEVESIVVEFVKSNGREYRRYLR